MTALRRVSRVARPLLSYPNLSLACGIWLAARFGPHLQDRFGLPALLATGAIGLFALWRGRRLPAGRRRRRRWREAAFSFLLLLDLALGMYGGEWIALAVFPGFLLLLYAGYRWGDLFLLYVTWGGLRAAALPQGASLVASLLIPQALLGAWIVAAGLFRSMERRKRLGVTDRLHLYEREAESLGRSSARVGAEIAGGAPARSHLAGLIRERERTFRDLLEVLHRSLDLHTCALYLYDAGGDEFIVKEQVTLSTRFSMHRISAKEGIFGGLHRELAPVRLLFPNGRSRGLSYYGSGEAVGYAAAFPLVSRGALKAALIADRRETLPFSPDESATLEKVAGQILRAIDQAEELHAYFQLKEELAAFYAASTALNRSLKVDTVVQTLLDYTQKIFPYDWGGVVLHDPFTLSNRVVAEAGPDQGGWVGRSFAHTLDQGLLSWVIANQTPLSYADFRSREGRTPLFHKYLKVPHVFDSILLVPMYVKGESLGAAFFTSRKNRAFPKNVRKMFEGITLHAAASLKNARMVSELERLATTDGLTGLVNHRAFQENLAAEMERVSRHGGSVSLLLIDLDYFKKVNDEFGHPMGDFLLKEVAAILGRLVRKVDTVARYGGEEFAVVLVNTTSRGSEQMAARIVKEIARACFEQGAVKIHATVSVGVASCPEDAGSREELIEFADRALYESKRRGRNRVTTYEPSIGPIRAEAREKRLVEEAEDQLRRAFPAGFDASGHPV